MLCKKVQTCFLEKLDGTLAVAIAAAVDQHLGQCDSCRQEYARTEKIIAAWKSAPVKDVPDALWERIALQTIRRGDEAMPSAQGFGRLLQWLANAWDEGTWGRKAAFSSAMAALLVVSVFWGTRGPRQPVIMPVVELTGNPVSAFPAYFRAHHDPANQPITDAVMVLAFNTSGDTR